MATTTTQIENNPIISRNRNVVDYETPDGFKIQIGCTFPRWWPMILLKELIDNAVDHAGTPAKVSIVLSKDSFSVQDNGAGIPAEKIASLFDQNNYTSSKSLFVVPSRGRLGNALKCVLRAPALYFDKPIGSHLEVDTQGEHRDIYWSGEGDPKITTPTASDIRGTRVLVHWKGVAEMELWGQIMPAALTYIVSAYAAVNPHVTFEADILGGSSLFNETPAKAAPIGDFRYGNALWYRLNQFQALTATLSKENQTVRDFITRFDSLSGRQKAPEILKEVGLENRSYLQDLTNERVGSLFEAMRSASKEVTPKTLTESVEKSLRNFVANNGVDAKEIVFATSLPRQRSKRMQLLTGFRTLEENTDGGICKAPYLIEVAAGKLPANAEQDVFQLCINGSAIPTVLQPTEFCKKEEGKKRDYKVALIMHIVGPNLSFLNNGKGDLSLDKDDELTKAFAFTFRKILEQLNREGKRETQDAEEKLTNFCRETNPTTGRMNLVDAYMKASGDNEFGATPRQVFYVIREMWLNAGSNPERVKDADHFQSTVLPVFQKEFKNETGENCTADWKVYYDERGHYEEPHSDNRMGIGTLSVQTNVNNWDTASSKYDGLDVPLSPLVFTRGPLNRYRYALYIEKEGFNEILQESGILKEYDLALFSSKGNASVASRTLAAAMEERGVSILCVHDFDYDGFNILNTLKTPERASVAEHGTKLTNVIDLGLNLRAIEEYGLESEPVPIAEAKPKSFNVSDSVSCFLGSNERGETILCGPKNNVWRYALESGDPIKIAEFFFGKNPIWKEGAWQCQRVELNAFTSDHFVQWLREELDVLEKYRLENETGEQFKVIPSDDVLKGYLVRAEQTKEIQNFIEKLRRKKRHAISKSEVAKVRKKIERAFRNGKRGLSWEEAVLEVI
jgi:hypothetical protein